MYYNYNDEEKRRDGINGETEPERKPAEDIDSWRTAYEYWRDRKYPENETQAEGYPVYMDAFNREDTIESFGGYSETEIGRTSCREKV